MICDRRSALIGAGLAALPIPTFASANPAAPAASGGRGAVLTYFADAPMVDPSGSLARWRSPPGFRGGAGVAALGAESLRQHGLLL